MRIKNPKKYVVLDYIIGQIEGYKTVGGERVDISWQGHCRWYRKIGQAPCEFQERVYAPTTDWSIGGPILMKYRKDIYGHLARHSYSTNDLVADLGSLGLHQLMRILVHMKGLDLMPSDDWFVREFGPDWKSKDLI